MNRILMSVCAVVILVGVSGCHCNRGSCSDRCYDCDKGLLGHLADKFHGEGDGGHLGLGNGNGHFNRGAGGPYAAGPASAAITYPYYTTRGPRDFLAKNPRGIGP